MQLNSSSFTARILIYIISYCLCIRVTWKPTRSFCPSLKSKYGKGERELTQTLTHSLGRLQALIEYGNAALDCSISAAIDLPPLSITSWYSSELLWGKDLISLYILDRKESKKAVKLGHEPHYIGSDLSLYFWRTSGRVANT